MGDGVGLWHRLRGHSLVEHFDVERALKKEGNGYVTVTGQKRTMFWLCSCGDPIVIYDQNAYERWLAHDGWSER